MSNVNRIIVFVFLALNNRKSSSKVVLIYRSIPEIIPYQHTWINMSYITNNGAILFLAQMSTHLERRRKVRQIQLQMLVQFFDIFIIIVAFILINMYYCQVYIAQIMKLDIKDICNGSN